MTGLVTIEATIAAAEAPVLVAMAEQLCEALRAGSDHDWSTQVWARETIEALGSEEPPEAMLVSLAPYVEDPRPLAAVEAELRASLAELMARRLPNGFLLTVFRHAGRGGALTERIRRLNLMACELSHDTRIGVIDVDAVLAHLGARALQSDWRLAGELAAEAAGHAIVAALLDNGLDTAVPADVQARAAAFHGGVAEMGLRVGARLTRRRAET